MIDRFLQPPAPPAALTAEQVAAIARETAREVVMELAAIRPDLRLIPAPSTPVELGDAVALAGHATLARAAEATPDPEPEQQPAPEPEQQPAPEPEQRRGRYVSPREAAAAAAAAERAAAADLFLADHLLPAEDPSAYVTIPDVVAAYEKWRPAIGAPEVSPVTMGKAVRRAGFTNVRQARYGDGPQYRGRGSTKPALVFGARLREVDDAPEEDHAPAPSSPTGAPASVVCVEPTRWDRSRERRTEDRKGRTRIGYPPGYDGDRPGREVTREYRDSIIMPLISQGWTYHKTNGNGTGKPRMVSPDGKRYSLANTPSDWRGLENAKSHLRQYLGAAL